MTCKFIKPDKTQCNAHAILNSEFCFRHDPSGQERAKQASQKGGENRRLEGKFGKKVKLNTSEDAKIFISHVINEVWTGKVPVKVGSSIGFLLRCWLEVYEKSDLEARIAALEEKTAQVFD